MFLSRGDRDVIVVVMNAPHAKDKFQDAKKLWKYAFANFKSYTAAKAGDVQDSVRVKRGSLRRVDIGVPYDLKVTALRGTKPSETVTTEVKLKEEKPMAPIKKGTVMGQLVAYEDGKVVSKQNLIALETAEKGGPLSYIGIADEDLPLFFTILGIILLILIIIYRVKTSEKRRRRKERRSRRNRRKRRHRIEKENQEKGYRDGDFREH